MNRKRALALDQAGVPTQAGAPRAYTLERMTEILGEIDVHVVQIMLEKVAYFSLIALCQIRYFRDLWGDVEIVATPYTSGNTRPALKHMRAAVTLNELYCALMTARRRLPPVIRKPNLLHCFSIARPIDRYALDEIRILMRQTDVPVRFLYILRACLLHGITVYSHAFRFCTTNWRESDVLFTFHQHIAPIQDRIPNMDMNAMNVARILLNDSTGDQIWLQARIRTAAAGLFEMLDWRPTSYSYYLRDAFPDNRYVINSEDKYWRRPQSLRVLANCLQRNGLRVHMRDRERKSVEVYIDLSWHTEGDVSLPVDRRQFNMFDGHMLYIHDSSSDLLPSEGATSAF